MKQKKKAKNAIEAAAAKVAGAGRPREGPEKKVVTLYLEAELYAEAQKRQGRQVSTLINDLLRAYLEANCQEG